MAYQEFFGPNAQAQADSWAAGATRGGNPFGSIPAPVNPNLHNPAELYSMAKGAGAASGAGAAANLNTVLPGGTAALGGGLNFANTEVSGQLPADVITQLQQQAAERGVATGMPGSPNSNAAYLRALGLTSLDMSRQGVKDLSTVIGSTPMGPQFNPNSQIPDAAQQLEQLNYNSSLAAAPDPRAARTADMAALYGGRGNGLPPYGGGGGADDFWQTDPTSWWRGGVSTPDTAYGGGGTPTAQPFDYTNLSNFDTSSAYSGPQGSQNDPTTGLPLDENGQIDWNAVNGGQDQPGNLTYTE